MNIKIRLFLVLILVFAFSSFAFADCADELDYHNAVTSAVAIGDASSGNCAEVSDCGALLVRENSCHSQVLTADGYITCNAATLYGVIFTGDGVTAGDQVVINDGTIAGGTAKVQLEASGTDGTWVFTPAAGILFGNRISVDVTISGGACSVTVLYTAPDG